MEQSEGLFATFEGFIHRTFGEELWGIPMTPIVIGAFLCGAMLFYLVMIRQVRRDREDVSQS